MDTSNHHNKVEARPADSIVSAVKVKTFTDSMNEHCDKNVMVVTNVELYKCVNECNDGWKLGMQVH